MCASQVLRLPCKSIGDLRAVLPLTSKQNMLVMHVIQCGNRKRLDKAKVPARVKGIRVLGQS